MTAREKIREIVDEQLARLSDLSKRGALVADELEALQSLTKTARLADGLEVPPEKDPTEGMTDEELERRANGR